MLRISLVTLWLASIFPCDGVPVAGYCRECEGCLEAHNMARSFHTDTPPLTWDTALAFQTQLYLDSQASQALVAPSCPPGQECDYGENVYHLGGLDNITRIPCAYAVYNWYRKSMVDEDPYNYSLPFYENPESTRQFTNVVWRNSTMLGCGLGSDSSTGSWVVMCRYQAKGNTRQASRQQDLEQVQSPSPQSQHDLPRIPQDLMAACHDLYPDKCPGQEDHCWEEWLPGTGLGIGTFCPRTCGVCRDQIEPEVTTEAPETSTLT